MTRDVEQGPTLGELVHQARTDRGYSFRDVERHSGGEVGASTVHRIEAGTRATLTPKTLTALSRALGVPVARLRAANGQTATVPAAPFLLPDRANGLTAKQRRLVLAVVDGLLDAGHR